MGFAEGPVPTLATGSRFSAAKMVAPRLGWLLGPLTAMVAVAGGPSACIILPCRLSMAEVRPDVFSRLLVRAALFGGCLLPCDHLRLCFSLRRENAGSFASLTVKGRDATAGNGGDPTERTDLQRLRWASVSRDPDEDGGPEVLLRDKAGNVAAFLSGAADGFTTLGLCSENGEPLLRLAAQPGRGRKYGYTRRTAKPWRCSRPQSVIKGVLRSLTQPIPPLHFWPG